MSDLQQELASAMRERQRDEVRKLLNMIIEAQRELDSIERQKGVIMESAFERISQFAVDRMSKRDFNSLAVLYRELPPDFKVWLDKIRDIFELTTGSKLEGQDNG